MKERPVRIEDSDTSLEVFVPPPSLEAERDRLREEITQWVAQHAEAVFQRQQAEEQLILAQAVVEQLNAKLAETDELEQSALAIQQQIAETRSDSLHLAEEISVSKKRIESLEAELASALKSVVAKDEECARLQSEMARAEGELATQRGEVERLSPFISQIGSVQEDLQRHLAEKQALENQVDDLQRRLAGLEETLREERLRFETAGKELLEREQSVWVQERAEIEQRHVADRQGWCEDQERHVHAVEAEAEERISKERERLETLLQDKTREHSRALEEVERHRRALQEQEHANEELRKSFELVQSERDGREQDHTALNQLRAELEHVQGQLRQETESFATERDSFNRQRDEFELHAAKQQQEFEESARIRTELDGRVSALVVEREEFQRTKANLEAEIAHLRQEHQTIAKERHELQQRFDSLQHDRNELERGQQGRDDRIEHMARELEERERSRLELQQRFDDVSLETDQVRNEVVGLRAQLENAEGERRKLMDQVAELETPASDPAVDKAAVALEAEVDFLRYELLQAKEKLTERLKVHAQQEQAFLTLRQLLNTEREARESERQDYTKAIGKLKSHMLQMVEQWKTAAANQATAVASAPGAGTKSTDVESNPTTVLPEDIVLGGWNSDVFQKLLKKRP